MIEAKQALLGALTEAIQEVSPGATVPAAFESPKQAAHGDLAVTAAMQLAKPLKKNPREVAQALIDALKRRPAAKHLAGIEIAGPGFINLRLTPEAKQSLVAEVLRAGHCFGRGPAHDGHVLVE
ncbi:MAG TPA: arginine--tRNA ligase, partial [Albitalea sp.]